MDNVKYMYIRDARNNPVGCIAMRQDGDYMRYAVSMAAPVDKFDRNIGKSIALGRLNKGTNSSKVLVHENYDMNDIVYDIMNDIALDKICCDRAAKCAMIWLSK